MNIDQAVGKLYAVLSKCKEFPEYVEALQSLSVLEDATEALYNSQKVLKLVGFGEFDKDLHGVMLHTAICTNNKLLI